MSPSALAAFYALASAVTFGAFSPLARVGLRYAGPVTGVYIGLWVGVILLGGASLLAVPAEALNWRGTGWFVLAGLTGPAAGRLTFFVAIRHLGVSRAMPLTALTPLLGIMAGVLFLGEKPGPAAWLGALSVAAGCALLTVKRSGESWQTRHLWLPIAHSVLIAISTAFRKPGLEAIPYPILGATVASIAALPAVGLYRRLASGEEDSLMNPMALWVYGACGMLNALAFYFFFAAIRVGELWLVLPLNYTAPLFSLLFTLLWLRKVEQPSALVGAGTLLLVAGAALVAGKAF